MKKMIFTIAMGVLCLCVTSCSDICEEAYVAEQTYKHYRENGYADSLVYKKEFIELYQSMTYDQKQQYKEYRRVMEVEAIELATYLEHTEAEALQMLSE